jgi:hypothetical protein
MVAEIISQRKLSTGISCKFCYEFEKIMPQQLKKQSKKSFVLKSEIPDQIYYH